jgi:hypothetical protein
MIAALVICLVQSLGSGTANAGIVEIKVPHRLDILECFLGQSDAISLTSDHSCIRPLSLPKPQPQPEPSPWFHLGSENGLAPSSFDGSSKDSKAAYLAPVILQIPVCSQRFFGQCRSTILDPPVDRRLKVPISF